MVPRLRAQCGLNRDPYRATDRAIHGVGDCGQEEDADAEGDSRGGAECERSDEYLVLRKARTCQIRRPVQGN